MRDTGGRYYGLTRRPASRTAIDVEALLVWTYRDQRADVVLGGLGGLTPQELDMLEVEPRNYSVDGCVMIANIAKLGVRVDRSMSFATPLHVDAEQTHQTVIRVLERPIALMVMTYARSGMRPDAQPFRPAKAVPVRDERGRVKRSYEPWDKHRNYGASLIEWLPAVGDPDVVRVEYALWRSALMVLSGALRGVLSRHDVCDPAAPEQATINKAANKKTARPAQFRFDFTQGASYVGSDQIPG